MKKWPGKEIRLSMPLSVVQVLGGLSCTCVPCLPTLLTKATQRKKKALLWQPFGGHWKKKNLKKVRAAGGGGGGGGGGGKRNGFLELDLSTVSALSSVSFSGNLELVYYLHGVSPARGAVLPAATINSALALHCSHSCPKWFA